jgi:hypothetical protein
MNSTHRKDAGGSKRVCAHTNVVVAHARGPAGGSVGRPLKKALHHTALESNFRVFYLLLTAQRLCIQGVAFLEIRPKRAVLH